MREYALIFRMDIITKEAQPDPEQMKVYMKDWMSWINNIAGKGQLSEGGNHFSYTEGMVLRPGNIKTGGPYVVNNESVAGFIFILADDLNGAARIAAGCPILQGEGTSVEIRAVESVPEMNG